MRTVSRLLMFTMLALVPASEVWAQTPAQPTTSGRIVTAEEALKNPNALPSGPLSGYQCVSTSGKPHPWPELRPFNWVNPGTDPLFGRQMLPNFGNGNVAEDIRTIQNIFLGRPGFEEYNKVLMVGLRLLNRDRDWDAATINEIREIISGPTGFTEMKYWEGFTFFGPMLFGGRYADGTFTAVSHGCATVVDPNGVEGYLSRSFTPRQGVWEGRKIALFIPKICFNVTIVEVEETNARLPEEPLRSELVNKTSSQEIIKINRDANGKELKPNDDKLKGLQFRFSADPIDGQSPSVNAFAVRDGDRLKATLNGLVVGKQYRICESVNSQLFIPEQQCIPVRAGAVNSQLTFVNTEQLPQQSRTVSPPPAPKRHKDDDDGFWTPTKIGLAVGAIVGGAFLGAKLANKKEIIEREVVIEPRKGTDNPGRPAGTTQSFTFGFSF